MNYEWLTLVPLAQTAITIPLSGFALLVIMMALGGYLGYQSGLRNILTIAVWSITAYLVCVRGGNFLVDLINRFWQNAPRMGAFAAGGDPTTIARFDPLIQSDFQVPLFFRFVAFITLVMFGFFFNRKAAWKGPPKEPLAKPLGLFVGGLIVLIWSNAAVVFWGDLKSSGAVTTENLATNILNTLPDLSLLLPSLSRSSP